MAAEDDWWQLLTCTHDFEAELSSELSVKAEEQVRIVGDGRRRLGCRLQQQRALGPGASRVSSTLEPVTWQTA